MIIDLIAMIFIASIYTIANILLKNEVTNSEALIFGSFIVMSYNQNLIIGKIKKVEKCLKI